MLEAMMNKDVGKHVYNLSLRLLKKKKKRLMLGWLKQGRSKTLDNNDMDHGNEDTGAKVF